MKINGRVGIIISLLVIGLIVSITACKKKVSGCTDTTALNYNPSANEDNGRCIKKVYGVMDSTCVNYNPHANADSGTCVRKIYGCMDSTAANYNPHATIDTGGCLYTSSLVFYPDAQLSNPAVVVLNNQTATATGYYSGSTPQAQCSNTSLANFNILLGLNAVGRTYTYTATSSGGSWSGSATIQPAICTPVSLPSGNVIFWTPNGSYLPITVTVNNISYTITQTLSTAPSSYPASNCANYGLPAGTYSYSAHAQNGTTWGPASFTITDGQLFGEELQ